MLLLTLVPFFTSCSVIMASNKEGTDVESIQNIRTRSQLIALGADPISHEKKETGELVESYKILKEKGSVARAFMHGTLDVLSGFLWELAGTPIESTLTQKKYFSVKVTYNEAEQIQKIELL